MNELDYEWMKDDLPLEADNQRTNDLGNGFQRWQRNDQPVEEKKEKNQIRNY